MEEVMHLSFALAAIALGAAMALLCVWRQKSNVLELSSKDAWLHDLVQQPAPGIPQDGSRSLCEIGTAASPARSADQSRSGRTL
jgi:hypothetical protein